MEVLEMLSDNSEVRLRVLIVDDDPIVRRFTALVLEALAHVSTIEAGDGATGVALASSERPDLILLDVEMPRMDGPQTLSRLRADPITAAIPVVFFSQGQGKKLPVHGVEAVLDKSRSPVSVAEAVLDTLSRVRTRAFRRRA